MNRAIRLQAAAETEMPMSILTVSRKEDGDGSSSGSKSPLLSHVD
jgi:hypothetical protein